MELISDDCAPEDFFSEPLEWVFRDGDAEWAVSFVATVPHGTEAEQLYGDLFECRLREIDFPAVPVPVGSMAEHAIIDKLQSWADSQKSREQQHALEFGKYPRMDVDMVKWRSMLWFIRALRTRGSRTENPD